MKILPCVQLSDEWFRLKRGRPSASCFGDIITPKKAELAAAHRTYIAQLIGDLYDPLYPRDGFMSKDMQEGIDREPESRRWFASQVEEDITQVGLVESDCGRFVCSPDGLVGHDGVLELKNPIPKIHVGYLLGSGGVPDEYKAQCHGHLVVTGRSYCQFVSYCPPLPAYSFRLVADKFTEALRGCLDQFWDNFQAALEKSKGAGL